jgi:hypothetical protein
MAGSVRAYHVACRLAGGEGSQPELSNLELSTLFPPSFFSIPLFSPLSIMSRTVTFKTLDQKVRRCEGMDVWLDTRGLGSS